jgi:hypothetical protein
MPQCAPTQHNNNKKDVSHLRRLSWLLSVEKIVPKIETALPPNFVSLEKSMEKHPGFLWKLLKN